MAFRKKKVPESVPEEDPVDIDESEDEPEVVVDTDDVADLLDMSGDTDSDARYQAMQATSSLFKGWESSGTALKRIRSIRTIFPQYDRCTRVGGHPLERWVIIHGASNNGKTSFGLGLGLSFLRRHSFFALLDAERSTPIEWIEQFYGAELAHHPGFVAKRPDNYEEAVGLTRVFCEKIAEQRDKGVLPKDTTGLVMIDSLRKLVPKNLAKKVADSIEKHGIDGAGGRAGQMRAALNAAWLDELIPMLDKTGCTVVAIARESEGLDPTAYENYKLTGGTAAIFDAALVLRVTRSGFVYQGAKDDPNKKMLGERHEVAVRKTKISGKEERTPKCYFHTSNGILIPPGFDLARDLFELAVHYKIITVAGSWFSWNGHRAQGENAFVKVLTNRQDLLNELDREVRQKFDPDEELPQAEGMES